VDCRSCGVVNAPGRRYCRECGGRLGQPCPVCHFFNAAEDKHCGGCGRRQKAAGPLAAEIPPMPAYAADEPGGLELDDEPLRPPRAPGDAGGGGPGVSQSEIDGLFENILDDEPAEDGA
jgi:hypothetical protein